MFLEDEEGEPKEEEELTEDAEALKEEMDKIVVVPPEPEAPYVPIVVFLLCNLTICCCYILVNRAVNIILVVLYDVGFFLRTICALKK